LLIVIIALVVKFLTVKYVISHFFLEVLLVGDYFV